MKLLYLSVVKEELFNSVIYMSVIASVLGLCICLINKIFKNKISSKFKKMFWMIFLIMLIIPISFRSNFSLYNYLPINFQNIYNNVSAREELNPINDSRIIESNNDEKSNYEEDKIINYLAYVPGIWYIVCLILIYLSCLLYFFILVRFYKAKEICDNRIFEECNKKFNIKNVHLIIDNKLSTPAAFGITKKYVIINENVLSLDDKKIEYIFMHELNHFKKKDNLLNILMTIIQCIHFFNPFVYFFFNEIRNSMEYANDEEILSDCDENQRKEYCKLLVDLSGKYIKNRPVELLCISESKNKLKERIKAIQNIQYFIKNNKIISVVSGLIIIILIFTLCARNNSYVSLNDLKRDMKRIYKIDNVLVEVNYKESNSDVESNYNIYIKDGIELVKSDTNVAWEDFKRNNYYSVELEEKTIYKTDIYDPASTVWFSSFVSEPNMGFIYKYEGIENINGFDSYKAIVFKGEEYSTIWVSVQYGIIMKYERVFMAHENRIVCEANYNYDFGKVTDDDMKCANEELYKDYRIIK